MNNQDVTETTIERIVEAIEALASDERWVNDILEISDSSDSKSVIKTVNHVARLVENEFDF